MKKVYSQKIKNLAIAYAIIGSVYMNAQDITGHQSADLATGRGQPTKLERIYLESLGADVSNIKANKIYEIQKGKPVQGLNGTSIRNVTNNYVAPKDKEIEGLNGTRVR